MYMGTNMYITQAHTHTYMQNQANFIIAVFLGLEYILEWSGTFGKARTSENLIRVVASIGQR